MAQKQLTPGGGLRSVVLALLLLHFGLHSVSGLQCYVCTSDDPGCDKDVASSLVSYAKECGPKSIGCAVHGFQYEYLFDTIFHRDCFYSYDLSTFSKEEYKGDAIEYFGFSEPDSYNSHMGHWGSRRVNIFEADPPLMIKRSAPSMPAKWVLQLWNQEKLGDLSNGVDFSKWTWPGYKKEPSPEKIKSLECFSCEFEVEGRFPFYFPEDTKFSKDTTMERNLPPCTSQGASPLKKVTCENAYGCATLMEFKNYAEQKQQMNKPFVSKVWRGCWYPGDYKCLRNPDPGRSGQERSFRSDSYDDQGSEKCAKAYQRSFNSTKGVVVWAGQAKIKSSTEYNKYLQCRHEVRLGAKADTKLELVNDTVKKNYAFVQYQFCGPRSKCNRFVNVSPHLAGNDKYNVKDYEAIGEVEEDESKTKCTNLGDCCEEEEDKGFKNGGGVISTKISYLFGSLLLLHF